MARAAFSPEAVRRCEPAKMEQDVSQGSGSNGKATGCGPERAALRQAKIRGFAPVTATVGEIAGMSR